MGLSVVCLLVLAPGLRGGVPEGFVIHARAGSADAQAGHNAYWTVEFRRRWLVERRDGRARARTIRRLRRLNRSLHAAVRDIHADRWLWDAFLCIHRYEGAWNDPDPPYFGGLQMDMDFQRAYGPGLLASKGTADRWTPAEQIGVAIRAYRSGRGFYPWPTTARMCGLI